MVICDPPGAASQLAEQEDDFSDLRRPWCGLWGATMPPMQEIELKLQIPEGGRAAIHQALSDLASRQGASLNVLPLSAAYFDTPQRHLAAGRMALRVRQEGDAWVQTLKAAGSTTLVRVEDNRALAPPADPSQVSADLSRHPAGPARDALHSALPWDEAADPSGQRCGLVALYQTDIARSRLTLNWTWADVAGQPAQGLIELALDEGWIGAGEHRLTVCELEIEALSGDPQAVIEAARWFVQTHGLWLDTRTKAHRGGMLADRAFGAAAASGQGGKPGAATPSAAEATALALGAWMAELARLAAWDTAQAGWPADEWDASSWVARSAALDRALMTWRAQSPLATDGLTWPPFSPPATAGEALTWARSAPPTLASLGLLSALLKAQAA
jgi:triphosphatase